jgi:hypothetical protein
LIMKSETPFIPAPAPLHFLTVSAHLPCASDAVAYTHAGRRSLCAEAFCGTDANCLRPFLLGVARPKRALL